MRCVSLLLLCMLTTVAEAQTDRYMVFFKDKNGSPYSISQPLAFLSQRSVDRRAKSNVSVKSEDIPVNASYVAAVRATGAKTFFTTRWMNALLVEATAAQIATIQSLPMVARSEYVAPGHQLTGGRKGSNEAIQTTSATVSTQQQLAMLGLDQMHADGYRGAGMLIAVFDAGFPGVDTAPPFQRLVTDGRIVLTKDFVYNNSSVFQYNGHGTEVLSVMGASAADFTGGVEEASYMLFVTEDYINEYRIEEFNWLFAAEKADSAGVDIIQASVGYYAFDDYLMDYSISSLDGKSAIVTQAASMAKDRAIVVCVSAGNEGTRPWHYITPPADADGILASGAVTSAGVKASFSSFGPTADNRIKPDVAAMGVATAVVLSNGIISPSNGTSFASPLTASLVAGLLQAFPNMKPAEIVSLVKQSASQSQHPDNNLGYGIPGYVPATNLIKVQHLAAPVYAFPNPVHDQLQIGFAKLPEGTVTIRLSDLSGRALYTTTFAANWGVNPWTADVSALPAGLYLAQVTTSTEVRVLKIIKF